MVKLVFTLVAVISYVSLADIVFENELIKTEEIFDLEYARSSDVNAFQTADTTKYYCVFRSNWSKDNHPAEFPQLARWGSQVLFSHTKQYAPYIKNRAAPNGVELLAETTFTSEFLKEIEVGGEAVHDMAEGKGFWIKKNQDDNIVYLPPVKVTSDHSFISGIAGMSPSPDWFSNFYLFDTIKETGLTYWENFLIRTYPWDAGTDDGEHYEAPDRDTNPPEFVTRIEVGNTVNDIFLSPAGDQVRHVAEWECVLHTCPAGQPDCEKPDWPPANGCDILRYPQCDLTCDPNVDDVCEQCRREKNSEEDKIFRPNCCLSGRVPKGGSCSDSDLAAQSGATSFSMLSLITTSILVGLTLW